MNKANISLEKNLSSQVSESTYPNSLKQYWPIPTQMTKPERLLLFELSQKVGKEAVIVEVGSYLGASTCFLAAGSEGKAQNIYAIDTWQNHAMSEGSRDTYSEFLKHTAIFEDVIVPLKGFSKEVAKDFDREIDLLFIDGDHSYEGATEDLKAWLPKVKKNGVVIFHDYGWSDGVQKAVQENVFPIQTDGGRCVDSIYWTKVNSKDTSNTSALSTSIIIPTYNRTDYALAAIKSVINQETSVHYEVIVIDNGCSSLLADKIQTIKKNASVPVIYVELPEIGLHNGRNVGAFLARGKIVVYVDDDVIVPPGWLNRIYAPFKDTEVGAVAGRSLPQWESHKPDWLSQIDKSYLSILDLGDEVRQLQWPLTPFGCNMAFRRDLVLGLRGFHPDGTAESGIQWHRGDGETGFTKKVYDAGYKVIYSGQAWLYHRIPALRLELAPLKNRAAKEAVSSCYTDIRTHKYRRWQLVLLASISLAKFARAAVYYGLFLWVFNPSQKIRTQLAAAYYWTATLYQLRLVLDISLRDWIFRSDYWPTSDRLREIFIHTRK